MVLHRDFLEIMNRLVGPVDENTGAGIYENIDCFLHPMVGLFVQSNENEPKDGGRFYPKRGST